jgi:hypothetical protein
MSSRSEAHTYSRLRGAQITRHSDTPSGFVQQPIAILERGVITGYERVVRCL